MYDLSVTSEQIQGDTHIRVCLKLVLEDLRFDLKSLRQLLYIATTILSVPQLHYIPIVYRTHSNLRPLRL